MINARARLERVAHRGAPTERTENTIDGFLVALRHGADAIELDVHVTRDGVVIVHHDDTVGSTRIADSEWKNLAETRLRDGSPIPELREVLQAVSDRAVVYIELKGSHIEDAVLRVTRQYAARYALHSFDHDAIERLAVEAPEVHRGVLLDRGIDDAIGALRRVAQRTHPRDVWPHYSLVDAAFMDEARRLMLRVIPWTVNSHELAERLALLGVAGVCTDDVRWLANL